MKTGFSLGGLPGLDIGYPYRGCSHFSSIGHRNRGELLVRLIFPYFLSFVFSKFVELYLIYSVYKFRKAVLSTTGMQVSGDVNHSKTARC